MNKFQEVYDNNRRLDSIFIERYCQVTDYDKMNCIEFLVELGEFINETKVFKYWSVKSPSKDKMLDEFADCVNMMLYFFNINNMKLEDFPEHIKEENTLDIINYLYQEGTLLFDHNHDPEFLRSLFSNLIYLGHNIGFSDEDIIDGIKKKQEVIEERLNSEY